MKKINMIKIRTSKRADTRSAEGEITKAGLLADTKAHIGDVQKGCVFMADMLKESGKKHDYTKMYI